MLSVEVLGPLRVRRDGREVPVTSPTQRLLLAVLAAAHPDVVPRSRLVDAVWDDPPPSAHNSLGSHLTRLRGLLGPDGVERVGDGYRLAVAPDAVALGDDPPAWDGAWRGPAFGDLAEHPMVRPAAVRLDERRADHHRARSAELLAMGRADTAIAELRGIVAERPYDERAWGLLVRGLGDSGRRAEALRAAYDARALLAGVGLEPSDELMAAEADQLGTSAPTGAATVGVPDGSGRSEGRLPRYRTRFHGRRDLLGAVQTLVADHEWVTVVGPGGVGKTRLAVEVAARHAGDVGFCDLSGVTAPEDVPAQVARAAGVDAVPPVAERAADALAERGLLLVIDNCEQVWEAVAAFGATLAAGGGGARVLATSRRPLRVDGEVLVDVDPLATDDAAALLLDRAADLGVHIDDPDAIAAVCGLADRLPLALEMAAGLLRTMSADDLVDRVDRRLELLGSGRARTLRATIDSSVEALGPLERVAFARLSVFAGPFSLAQAERVIADGTVPPVRVASLVAALRDQSLLQSAPGPTGHRVRMLPILRDVAAEHLGADADSTRQQHLAVFVDEAEAIDRGVRRPDEAVWAVVAGTELADLRAALRHALASGSVDDAARIAAGLFHLVYGRVRPDIGSWSFEVLEAGPPHDVRLHARLRATAALAAFQSGDVDGAFETASAAREIAGGDPVRRFADLVLANVDLAAGRLADALRAGEQAAGDAKAASDQYVAAVGHVLAALALGYDHDVDTALEHVGEARRAAAVIGSPTAVAYVDYAEAEILADLDPPRAEARLEQAIAAATAVGATLAEGVAWVTLSSIRARHGDPTSAVAGFQEAIRRWRDRGDAQRQWVTLRNLADLLARIGHHIDAAVILGAVEASAAPPYGAEAVRLADTRRQLLDHLGPTAEHHLATGRTLPRREIIDRCLTLQLSPDRP